MGILCVTSFFSCSKEFALDRKQSGFIKFSTHKFNSNKVTKLLRSFKTPSGVLKNFKANLWPAPDSIVTGEKRWLEKSINYSGRGQNKVETFAHKMSIHQVPSWLVREQKPVCSALDGCLPLSPWSGHRDDVPVMASCCANVCDVGLWTCSSKGAFDLQAKLASPTHLKPGKYARRCEEWGEATPHSVAILRQTWKQSLHSTPVFLNVFIDPPGPYYRGQYTMIFFVQMLSAPIKFQINIS